MSTRLYTIGHSRHSAEQFVRLLEAWRVSEVVDVRRIPFSRRNPQFNRERLAISCANTRSTIGISRIWADCVIRSRPRTPATSLGKTHSSEVTPIMRRRSRFSKRCTRSRRLPRNAPAPSCARRAIGGNAIARSLPTIWSFAISRYCTFFPTAPQSERASRRPHRSLRMERCSMPTPPGGNCRWTWPRSPCIKGPDTQAWNGASGAHSQPPTRHWRRLVASSDRRNGRAALPH